MIPSITKEFREIDGYAYVISFFESLVGLELDPQRVDQVRRHTMILNSCLRVFLTLSELGPTSKKILSAHGIFTHLLALLSQPQQSSEIITTSMLICSSLCSGFKANKQVFGEANGVQILLPFLTYSSADPQEYENVILATVECIWGTICCVLDMLENPKSIYHIIQWRTKKDVTRGIAHLLITLWQEEEQELGVPMESLIQVKSMVLRGANQPIVIELT